ncbi:MAG: hypothetical protein L3J20_10355 [Flavobacteriaceae bacterium]|nr:hypothetical protein [Flavobacteriaceae bacterium]
MQWLEKLQPPKFLRYMFYKLYMFALKTNNSTPKLSVAITLAFTHLLQLFFTLDLFRFIGFNIWENYFSGYNKIIVAIFSLLFLYIIELFYHYKDKHLKYVIEFENEIKSQKKRGTIYLFIYLFISIALLYVSLWLLTINNPNYL